MDKAPRILPTLLLGVLALLGSQEPASAAQFCVNSAASLKTALTTAASNGVDDEVRIVQGTYVGNFVYASTQANKLSVLGGYTAGCVGRVLAPVNTILDGNQTNSVLVLSAPDVAANLLVEGVTLRNGKPTSGEGGGLFAKAGTDGAVTVNRNRIENNAIRDVGSTAGGGAYISATTATFTNNSITGNTGIGAYIFNATTATLISNSITGNTDGGASIYNATTATFTNNWISGNTGSGADIIFATTATLINNGITGTVGGTGANIIATTATLTSNTITGNKLFYGKGGGGADISATTVTLTNNNIAGNMAPYGGGAEIWANIAILTNNNITSNTAHVNEDFNEINGTGGGLLLGLWDTETIGSAKLYNNLFWDNVAQANEGADLLISNDSDNDYLPTPVLLLANNFDQAQPTGFSSDLPITIDPSNLNKIDPLFVGAGVGDFHLQPGSPMINAGYPGTPDLPVFDIAGTPRVLGDSVDIGAYEYDDGSFYDVDHSSWAYGYINAIRDAGITGGCGNGNYCPQGLVTREQMAAFLIRAIEGDPSVDYCNGVDPFLDVASGAWSCPHIKRMGELNITGGCGGGNYCPQGLVTREQMAVFIVRALEGNPAANYCSGVAPFNDVSAASWSCGHIKRLVDLEITKGCGNDNYCPGNEVTREQMAAFLARAFLGMD